MTGPLDYRCPTCGFLVSPGYMHGCMDVAATAISDAGVGPTTSQVQQATPQEAAAEAASLRALTGNRQNVPLSAQSQSQYTGAPQVVSIAITPLAASVSNTGGTQQYAANATFSDGSVSNIAPYVSWVSSNTGKATIAASGLATGASGGAGTTNISCSFTTPAGVVLQSAIAVLTLT